MFPKWETRFQVLLKLQGKPAVTERCSDASGGCIKPRAEGPTWHLHSASNVQVDPSYLKISQSSLTLCLQIQKQAAQMLKLALRQV